MDSIKSIFRIGNGPSSSHTMGPVRAAEMFLSRCPDATRYVVHLYGSLATTGKGHMTDAGLQQAIEPKAPCQIEWHYSESLPEHPNGMTLEGWGNDAEGQEVLLDSWTVYSVGGGALACEEFDERVGEEVYPKRYIKDILSELNESGRSFWSYVEEHEESDIWDYLDEVWSVMRAAVLEGLDADGMIPGGLGLQRKAARYWSKAMGYGSMSIRSRGLVYAYALAVSEQNACLGRVVTAPTCGSCGVIPAILYHLEQTRDYGRKHLLRSLATAGLFGNVVRTNASISGAEVGCQGEVGVACAMGAAAACQLFGGSLGQIEYSAEMGLEHHLGLTCDPVCGLVQIPCIERNAFAAARALDANTYGTFSDGQHRVSFDQVVEVMRRTGKDLPSLYRETAEGGLAIVYKVE